MRETDQLGNLGDRARRLNGQRVKPLQHQVLLLLLLSCPENHPEIIGSLVRLEGLKSRRLGAPVHYR